MLEARPPIVTVLGHVDHGKTTLLDSIRKTNVAGKESGGITQSIGASVVKISDGSRITFIDTPGHAAFSKMRSRGAKVADIAILVVAAGDGVKPQTKEALEHIIAAKLPYIVAITKTDISSSSLENVKNQLVKEGVLFEGGGGDVPIVLVSGKTGKGVTELLDMIGLMSQVHDVKADKNTPFDGVVIETSKGKSGPLASVVVRNGTIKVGEEIVSDTSSAKIRALFNYAGESVKEVLPGEPVQILGFKELPHIGSRLWLKGVEEIVAPVKQEKKYIQKSAKENQIAIVVKTKSAGTLEALLANIPKEVEVVYSGVGDVSETDVFMAKSANVKALYVFEARVSKEILRLADTEDIQIKIYKVVYELLDDLDKLLKMSKDEILGEAEILEIFPYNNKKVAGGKVIKGEISRQSRILVKRGDKVLGEAKIVSMKKEKTNVDKVKIGEEFGVILSPKLDFGAGDMLVSVRKQKS